MSFEKDRLLLDQYLAFLRCYPDIERVRLEILDTIQQFPALRPSYGVIGAKRPLAPASQLLNLQGTIPINFKGNRYNIPIQIWIQESFPNYPPIIYVTPTQSMIITPKHPHCDIQGLVYHPYISAWTPKNRLSILLFHLTNVFSESPPVRSSPPVVVTQQQATFGQFDKTKSLDNIISTRPTSVVVPNSPLVTHPITSPPGYHSTVQSQQQTITSIQPPIQTLSQSQQTPSISRPSSGLPPMPTLYTNPATAFQPSPPPISSPTQQITSITSPLSTSTPFSSTLPNSQSPSSIIVTNLSSPLTQIQSNSNITGMPSVPIPVPISSNPKPPPFPGDISNALQSSLNQSTNSTNQFGPLPIPSKSINENSIKSEDQLNLEVKKKLQELQDQISEQLKSINDQIDILEIEERKLNLQFDKSLQEQETLSNQIQNLQSKGESINQWIETRLNTSFDIDKDTQTPDPFARQILDRTSEDKSIDDCLYNLNDIFSVGLISLEEFIKEVRLLSREQFYKKELIKKIHIVRKESSNK